MKKKKTGVGRKKKAGTSKVDLFSTLSHEVRTPLTSIGGYIKLLLNEDVGALNGVQREYLNIVDTNVVRLTRLINEILDYQVLESGEIPIQKRVVQLESILQECCDTFRVIAAEKKLKLELEISEGLRPIFGDRTRLVQVFMNLISNAIKFTTRGGVSIKVSDGRAGVSVRIQDTGMGMKVAEKKKLFQKFYRTPSSREKSVEGTGLGLFISHGLIKAHGGKIQVKSQWGDGSCFTVTLPAA
jgi:signal transduction histidine kinase